MSRIKKLFALLLHVEDSPERVARAFGLGVFIAFSPLLGVHTGLALAVAFAFRLNRVAILAGAWLNNPWTIAPLFTAGTLLGCVMLGVPTEGFAIDWGLEGQAFWDALFQTLRPYVMPYILGNTVLGVVGGVAGYYGVRAVLLRRRPVPPSPGPA
jgi:uncharacterized protein (DUF2062 family)